VETLEHIKRIGKMVDFILKKWKNFIINSYFDDKNDHTQSIKKSLIKMQKFKSINPNFDDFEEKLGLSFN
jgi:hypothetical protein